MKKFIGGVLLVLVVLGIGKEAVKSGWAKVTGDKTERNIYKDGAKDGLENTIEVGKGLGEGALELVEEHGGNLVDKAVEGTPVLIDKALEGAGKIYTRVDSVARTPESKENWDKLGDRISNMWNSATGSKKSSKSIPKNKEPNPEDIYIPTRNLDNQ